MDLVVAVVPGMPVAWMTNDCFFGAGSSGCLEFCVQGSAV